MKRGDGGKEGGGKSMEFLLEHLRLPEKNVVLTCFHQKTGGKKRGGEKRIGKREEAPERKRGEENNK